MRALMLGVLVAVLAGPGSGGRPASANPTLKDLDFMAGCWRGMSPGGAIIEEYYTAPTDNLILGVTRYTKGGRVTSYEFTTIAREDSGIVLTPRPAGQEPAPFRLTRLEGDGAVWENPAHDFPTLIAYRSQPGDSLVARIEGPGREGRRSMEWRMGRSSCGG
jgi:Domain of unknown function (DUF6265)